LSNALKRSLFEASWFLIRLHADAMPLLNIPSLPFFRVLKNCRNPADDALQNAKALTLYAFA
jgi:hypothetical protein